MRLSSRFLGLALLLAPLPAQAQFLDVVSGLFDSVNSILFYTQVGALSDNTEIEGTVAGFGVAGLGTEVLLNLPSFGGSDFELGLGTSFVRGFEATDPTLDLRTSVRTLPSVAVVASGLGVREGSPLIPYASVNFGIVELWNARGYALDGTVYPLTADSYEIGISGGLFVDTELLRGLYVEVGYRQRNFESLSWDATQLPPGWPRAIDASAWTINLGWQFTIRGDEEE